MMQAFKQALTKGKNFDFEKYGWNIFTMWLDPLTKRKFNENSKFIQVEGNIKCGKQDFAKRLADQLGMLYIPPVDVDSYYYNEHGYDYRALNPLLPERMRNCDWAMFHEQPSRHSNIHLQEYLMRLRLLQYIRAIRHIFNTGQGVILGRSIFTERAIVEAMHHIGWLPKGYVRGDGIRFYDWKYRYIFIRNLALTRLFKPHLTIYLDTPVDVCMDNIKNCNDPMIRESKAHVPEFLESVERAYHSIVLPAQAQNGHLLSYEYSKRATDADISDVVDDIKQLNFEYSHSDTLFQTWHDEKAGFYFFNRWFYSSKESSKIYTENLAQDYYDIAGLGDSISQTDVLLRNSLYLGNVVDHGNKFAESYNLKHKSIFDAIHDYEPLAEYEEKQIRVYHSS